MLSDKNFEITDFEKQLYNQYLIVSRTSQNQPFKIRKNFDKFSQENVIICKKIAQKLYSYPNINLKDFFFAPFFEDKEARITLAFYATPKAISSYVRYMKHIESLDPDDTESLLRARDSLLFIKKYCDKNKLDISDYFTEKQENQFTCLLHLKDRKTWLYPLLDFNGFDKAVLVCDKDIVRLMNGDNFFDKIDFARNRYIRSTKCKQLVQKIKIKLKLIEI
jgi:hypothetical protein